MERVKASGVRALEGSREKYVVNSLGFLLSSVFRLKAEEINNLETSMIIHTPSKLAHSSQRTKEGAV